MLLSGHLSGNSEETSSFKFDFFVPFVFIALLIDCITLICGLAMA
jgi:hypothetical protein